MNDILYVVIEENKEGLFLVGVYDDLEEAEKLREENNNYYVIETEKNQICYEEI